MNWERRYFKRIWPWLYSSGVCEELLVINFAHISWTFQCVTEQILFSRLLDIPVFKDSLDSSTAKVYGLASLLFAGSKTIEKLVNNRLVDYLEKCGLFADFQYGFRSLRSTADLLYIFQYKECYRHQQLNNWQSIITL